MGNNSKGGEKIREKFVAIKEAKIFRSIFSLIKLVFNLQKQLYIMLKDLNLMKLPNFFKVLLQKN